MSRPLAQSVGSQTRNMSHGRGGAGNMGAPKPTTDASQLVTPTIKSDKYTTGRGGSGNMASNDPNRPEVARAAQDVEAPPIREPEGNVHYGRGGAANVARLTEEQKGDARMRNKSVVEVVEEKKGVVEKGKEMLSSLARRGSMVDK
ncbi:hypothetical protein LTR28_007906 [Elasticomyces elasticus]|nr:hypothetical protein LTR28_007906 [Elasticomyces elasticus]